MERQVKLSERQHDAVSRAILAGAFGPAQAQFTALMCANKDFDRVCDNLQRDADNLCEAAKLIVNAQPTPQELAPIDKLSDDDIIRVCNFMEAEGKAVLEMDHGGFVTAFNETLVRAARAYYHADSHNRLIVKSVFGGLYVYYHRKRAVTLGEGAKA